MEKNNWYNKYYIQKEFNENYSKYLKYFKNKKEEINLEKKINFLEKNYKIEIDELKKKFENENYINNLKNLTSLEILQNEMKLIKILSKYCLENNILDYYFFYNSLQLFSKINNILKNRLNQPTINHENEDINLGIPRCSYKFCNFKASCSYNYNNKYVKGNKNICYQDHYVHNMVSADINILIKYIELNNQDGKIKHNKEILKSINTLCYVINHMENELKEKCMYLNKSEWEKFHKTKKVINKIIKA